MAGIRLEGLSRSFGGRAIFAPVTLEARGPGLFALVGANGSGKTTLLRILATLTAPTAGEGWVAGASIRAEAARVRERIGYLPASDGSFFKRLTGDENLELFGGLRGLERSRIRHAVDAWSEVLPLREARRIPFQLASAGMRQALGLCRALLHDPEVLLLDEPTRSLDPEAGRSIRASLRVLAEQKTVLWSTHREDEWAGADQVWELRDGALRERNAGFADGGHVEKPLAAR